MELLSELLTVVSVAAAAAEAPSNEFGYWSHPRPWWEVALPYVMFGVWFAICGVSTWLTAVGLLRSWGASRVSFALSASVPLLIFTMIYIFVSLLSGATSVLEIVKGISRFEPEGYALLVGTVVVGCVVAWLNFSAYKRAKARALQECLGQLN
ncbi:MAG: hypothetical protein AAGK01_12400 [Pseudomonadota bacterium]